ncbi:Citrate transporter [Methyloligella halotolerans]|uniref:Citrate transporter n=1 Tax=Methyloligella halotolerans TaxID=1177755 RepID=A0A1E2RUL6_9HYPH|nr:SLC13 family permease [Methyloligella halotolerans]ODA65946.1 Citrate transporter [Methyloligella halotolerans]
MSPEQIILLLLLAGLLCAFAVDRFRIELVALSGLAAALLLGLVPLTSAFSGFANQAVITLAELLILTRLISRSRLMDGITRRLATITESEPVLLATICGLAALTSVFINNIGALALWLPVALALCKPGETKPARLLMPLSFATLLGGTCSLIGTPANLVVASFDQSSTGTSLGFFDIAIGGLPATLVGLAFLVLAGPRILGRSSKGTEKETGANESAYVTELRIPTGSSLCGRSFAEAENDGWQIHSHLRDGRHVFGHRERMRIEPGDVLLVEAPAAAIEALTVSGDTEFNSAPSGSGDVIEAIVLPQSMIVGSTPDTVAAFSSRNIALVAIATRHQRIEGRLSDVQFRPSDIVMLHGEPDAIAAALYETDCLPLAPQSFESPAKGSWVSLAAFAVAVLLAATNLLPPEIAFGGAILALSLFGAANLRDLVADLNWPILIMLAAMIPIGEAVATTGLANASAEAVIDMIGSDHPTLLLASLLFCAVVLTPFVNNVSAAVALAPIAIAVAKGAGVDPEPYLIAVAIGVSLDFLTPFGHHNNALVMSVGGYRFLDFPRLGVPLVLLAGGAAILGIHIVYF